MDPVLIELGQRAVSSIAAVIGRDAEFRIALRDIARRWIDWLDAAAVPAPGMVPAAAPATSAAPVASAAPTAGAQPWHESTPATPAPATIEKPDSPPRQVQRMTLRIGDELVAVDAEVERAPGGGVAALPSRVGSNPRVVAEPPARGARDDLEPDADLIAARSRLKAEACRLSGERRRRRQSVLDPREVNDAIGPLVARAKALPHCYLWSIDPNGPQLPADASLEELAGGYDALADAVEVLARCGREPELAAWVEPAARLAAEAQSALRAAMFEVDLVGGDRDQLETFRWLTGLLREQGLYIHRHMRADDPADPAAWKDLRGRVKALADSIEQRRQSKREREQLYGKVRYLVGRLVRERPGPDAAEWTSLGGAVEALLALKVAPSDGALRENLLPLVESDLEVPDDYMREGSGVRLVLDQLGRYLETAAPDAEKEADARAPRDADDFGPDVAEVARLLRGRRVVLIGGEPRPQAKAALERAFGLDELTWLSAPAHSSYYHFEPAVARPDTAVILLMIRWSSHSFGEVKSICDRHGKPLVRLPGGYNPAQVAFQILQQCGGQLAATADLAASAGRPLLGKDPATP